VKVKPLAQSRKCSLPRAFECSALSRSRLGFQRHRELRLGCDNTDPTSLPRTGLPPNDDLDVLVERR
jgi:hypothetical protein